MFIPKTVKNGLKVGPKIKEYYILVLHTSTSRNQKEHDQQRYFSRMVVLHRSTDKKVSIKNLNNSSFFFASTAMPFCQPSVFSFPPHWFPFSSLFLGFSSFQSYYLILFFSFGHYFWFLWWYL